MNNIARVWLAAAFCIVALSPSAWAASVYEHGVFESVSLNGEWEMAYRPYAHEVVECPAFRGVKVRNAVPGYWEDMVPELRSSGMADEFRINPLYERQRLPISGSVGDTTLPNIYGCFLYRKSIDLKRAGPAVLAFEGVRNQVHVWINGMFVAYRAGFSTPFELEVKDGVLKVGLNEIVLAVSNNPNLGYCDYVSGLATRSTFASTGGVNGNLELRFPRNGLGDVAQVRFRKPVDARLVARAVYHHRWMSPRERDDRRELRLRHEVRGLDVDYHAELIRGLKVFRRRDERVETDEVEAQFLALPRHHSIVVEIPRKMHRLREIAMLRHSPQVYRLPIQPELLADCGKPAYPELLPVDASIRHKRKLVPLRRFRRPEGIPR